MTDIDRSIRNIAQELRQLQEQLVQAGLLPQGDERRDLRWELARRMGSLIERLQTFFSHQPHAHQQHPVLVRAPRPD